MVHRVVVDQGRQVDQLHRRGEGERILVPMSPDLIHQKEEGRPEEFAPHPEEDIVDILQEVEIGDHDPPDHLHDSVEAVLHRLLDEGQPGNGRSRRWKSVGHGVGPQRTGCRDSSAGLRISGAPGADLSHPGS